MGLLEGVGGVAVFGLQHGGGAVSGDGDGAVDIHCHFLRCIGAIDDFDDDFTGGRVAGGGVEDRFHFIGPGRLRHATASASRLNPGVRGEILRRDWEHFVALVFAEHFLNVVGRRSVASEGIVADEIGFPLHRTAFAEITDIDKERCVAVHQHNVGIALQAAHPGGISQRARQVGRGRTDARGPFADENFGGVAPVPGIINEGLGFHFLLGTVVMLIHQIGRAAMHLHGFRVLEANSGNDF